MKKKMKNFFTLTRKANGGFTLVELIVVIAILAILGGVAVPAYSGYIEKSKRAADDTLLAAVNTAYAAACAANGSDIWLQTHETASAPVVGGKVTAITPAEYDEAFDMFFEGNEDAVFQVYTQLKFDDAEHVFVGVDEEALIAAIKQYIANSSYNGHISELTGDVGKLVENLKGYLASDAGQSITGGGFDTYMKEVLGLENPTEQEMANAAVLYLGYTAANMTEDDIDAAKTNVATQISMLAGSLADDDPNNDTLDFGACSTVVNGSQLASYAALYAAAEAVALSENAKGNSTALDALNKANPSNPQSVVSAVTDVFKAAGSDALAEYITPTEGENLDTSSAFKDMDAYFETMKAVNSKENELKGELGTENLYTTDPTIQDLLNQLEGK